MKKLIKGTAFILLITVSLSACMVVPPHQYREHHERREHREYREHHEHGHYNGNHER